MFTKGHKGEEAEVLTSWKRKQAWFEVAIEWAAFSAAAAAAAEALQLRDPPVSGF
jgi:hypothetical protein